ncbi:unnamed protein product [Mytilus coruscus]|uniref:Uncharacterized protein n=1 Tax=Mytilus coruscus TaxID=42192 RepID=A0A6J8ETW0_MYTCO|nr:unnamed protein product [Mytilus coruscus]
MAYIQVLSTAHQQIHGKLGDGLCTGTLNNPTANTWKTGRWPMYRYSQQPTSKYMENWEMAYVQVLSTTQQQIHGNLGDGLRTGTLNSPPANTWKSGRWPTYRHSQQPTSKYMENWEMAYVQGLSTAHQQIHGKLGDGLHIGTLNSPPANTFCKF